MDSINKVTLIGRLGKAPKVITTKDSKQFVTFSIATSESWKDKITGEKKEKTEWHNTVVFNPHLSNIAAKYLRKGSKVYLEGALSTRKWIDPDGNERYTTEIVLQYQAVLLLLDGKSNAPEEEADEIPFDDEIPF